jgi:membrane fusion protein
MDNHFPLFRQEALEHVSQRSFLSHVIVTTPIRFWASTTILLGFTTVGLYLSTLVQLPRTIELSGQIEANPAAEISAQLWADANTTTNLRSGQEVQVKYAAFPFQTYGVFTGRVKTIAQRPLAATTRPYSAKTFSYPVEVELKQQHIAVANQLMPLRPGMTFTANILLERKTLFNWLLEPLTRGQKNGGI